MELTAAHVQLQTKARRVVGAWRGVSNRLGNLFSMRALLRGDDAEIINGLIQALQDLEKEVEEWPRKERPMAKDIDPKTGSPEASDKTKRLEALEAAHGELAERVKTCEEWMEKHIEAKKDGDGEDW